MHQIGGDEIGIGHLRAGQIGVAQLGSFEIGVLKIDGAAIARPELPLAEGQPQISQVRNPLRRLGAPVIPRPRPLTELFQIFSVRHDKCSPSEQNGLG